MKTKGMSQGFLVLFMMMGAALSASAAQAGSFDRDPYYTITNVKVQEVQEAQDVLDLQSLLLLELSSVNPDAGSALDSGTFLEPSLIETLDEMIALGKRLWQIVVENKPVSNFSQNSATILPKNVTDWQQLQGWQTPQSRTYRILFENGYGMDVVDFTYRVLFTYGGNERGNGKYLANVTVVPASLDVAWGFTFNADVKIPSITNAGTHKSPIAASEIQVHWSVDTVVKHSEGTENFYMRGDGFFQKL